MPNGSVTANGTGANTPALESSNATDDERPPAAKKVRVEEPPAEGLAGSSNRIKVAEDTPAASDEDEDELEFENV
jgi:transcription initiation factor TFIIE subunit alpha